MIASRRNSLIPFSLACLLLVASTPLAVWSQEKSKVVAAKPETGAADPEAAEAKALEKSLGDEVKSVLKSAEAAKSGSNAEWADKKDKSDSPPGDKSSDRKAEEKKGDEKSPPASNDAPGGKKDDAKSDDKTKPADDAGKSAENKSPEKTPVTVPERTAFLELLSRKEAPGPQSPGAQTWACADENEQWIKDAYAYSRRLDVITRFMMAKHKNNQLQDLTMQQITATHLMNVTLGRLVEKLGIVREPASADLNAHHGNYVAVINFIVVEYTKTPGIPAEKIRAQADKLQKQLVDKELPRIVKLIEAKKFLEAEDRLDKIYDALDAFAVWLPGDRQRLHKPFGDQRQKYRQQLIAELRQAAASAWKVRQLDVGQNGFPLQTQVEKAGVQLSRGTTTQWREKTVTGPELIDSARRDWLAEMPEFSRISGYGSLMTQATTTDGSGTGGNDTLIGPPKDYGKFIHEFVKTLAGVIERDAADCAPEDVPALYAAYLRSVAGLHAEVGDYLVPFEKPLDALAKLNPDFYQNEVLKYRSMVQPMIDFRTAWAGAVYREETGDLLPVAELFRRAYIEEKKNGTAFVRATSQAASPGSNVSFFPFDPVLPTVRRRGKRVLQQPAILPRVVTDPTVPHHLLSPLHSSCIGMIKSPPKTAAIKKQLDALRRDLLVDEKNPPLSLPAAVAIWKAEEGHWQSVGADVENYFVDMSQSLLVKAAYDEPWFAHLDELPMPTQLGQMYIRYECSEPYWVSHELFFCDLNTE